MRAADRCGRGCFRLFLSASASLSLLVRDADCFLHSSLRRTSQTMPSSLPRNIQASIFSKNGSHFSSPVSSKLAAEANGSRAVEGLCDFFKPSVAAAVTGTAYGDSSFINGSGLTDEKISPRSPPSPIPSGQPQLPLLERIAKAIHEESAPWMLALTLPVATSILMETTTPLYSAVLPEVVFLFYCITKLVTNFDIPTAPQPLLHNRQWEDVRRSVWASQPDVESRRSFLMGWFYDAPFESLRREDALNFLAWWRYSSTLEHLSIDQQATLIEIDLIDLEMQVNSGNPLPSREVGIDEPLGCVRFNLEPLRFRHKPLLFYGVTHGAFHLLTATLKENHGFQYIPPANPKTDLGYWYRPPVFDGEGDALMAATPLVFVHGVGGMACYYNLLADMVKEIESTGNSTPMILLDLPFVSLRLCDDIPSIKSQVHSICAILDKTAAEIGTNKAHNNTVKATFVGHSFGSIVLSWMVQSRPERVANCVFIEPVCFQLHLKDILFNFHMKRVDKRTQSGKKWDNPMSPDSLISLFGSEMHTNNAMLRHFWWASNALWPQELVDNGISASIILSGDDEIVPTRDVVQLVSKFNSLRDGRRKRWGISRGNVLNDGKAFVRTHVLEGATHGEIAIDEACRKKVVRTTMAMVRLNNIKQGKQLQTISAKNQKTKKSGAFSPSGVARLWRPSRSIGALSPVVLWSRPRNHNTV